MSAENLKKLERLIKNSHEVKAVKNVNEHLNCTKQGCFSSWTSCGRRWQPAAGPRAWPLAVSAPYAPRAPPSP